MIRLSEAAEALSDGLTLDELADLSTAKTAITIVQNVRQHSISEAYALGRVDIIGFTAYPPFKGIPGEFKMSLGGTCSWRPVLSQCRS